MAINAYESLYEASVVNVPVLASDTEVQVNALPDSMTAPFEIIIDRQNSSKERWWVTSTSSSGGVNKLIIDNIAKRGLTDSATLAEVLANTGSDSDNRVTHNVGAVIEIPVSHLVLNDKASLTEDNTFAGDNTHSGDNTFSGDVEFDGSARFPVYADATARDAAITSPSNGMMIYNTAVGKNQQYISGGWDVVDTGATDVLVSVSADDTTPGYLEDKIVAGNGIKVTTLNDGSDESVQIEAAVGDGTDGIQGDANLTITGSNNTVIVKEFTSWTAGSVARTCTVTPTGCVTVLKIQGDADFTNWTFDFAGKGMPGGAGGTAGTSTGDDGTDGTASVKSSLSFANTAPSYGVKGTAGPDTADAGGGGGGGGGGASIKDDGAAGSNGDDGGSTGGDVGEGGDGGTAGSTSMKWLALTATAQASSNIPFLVAQGGSGGGGGAAGTWAAVPANAGEGGNGGAGGAGGGTLIIQVGGDVTFSSTSIDCSGENGSNGANGSAGGGSPEADGGGGGGGGAGAGGIAAVLYKGSITGSVTPDVSAGTAGTGGTGATRGGDGGDGGDAEDGLYAVVQSYS